MGNSMKSKRDRFRVHRYLHVPKFFSDFLGARIGLDANMVEHVFFHSNQMWISASGRHCCTSFCFSVLNFHNTIVSNFADSKLFLSEAFAPTSKCRLIQIGTVFSKMMFQQILEFQSSYRAFKEQFLRFFDKIVNMYLHQFCNHRKINGSRVCILYQHVGLISFITSFIFSIYNVKMLMDYLVNFL